MTDVIRDIFSVAKSKAAMICFAMAKAIIIARFLGPDLNGIIASLVVYPTLFMTIGSLGIRKSSAFLLGSGQFEEDQIKASVLHLWMLSACFSIVSIYFLIIGTSRTTFDGYLIGLAIAPVPFALLNTYLSGIYLGKNEIKAFNEVSWLPTMVVLLFTCIFIIGFDLSVRGALAAEVLGNFAMSVVLLFRMRFYRYFSFQVNGRLLKSLLALGVAYAVSLLVLNLNYRVDILLLDWYASPYDIGIYSKGAVLSQYLWEIPMLLGTIVFARGARSKDRELFSRKVCQLLRVSLVFIFVGSVFLAAVAKYVILILFGEEFLPSVSVMQLLLPGVLLLTIFKVLNMDMGGQGKPWFALKSMIPALIINIVLNIVLIPRWGADGAAISSTVSYSFGAMLFVWQYSNATGIRIREIFRFSMDDFSFAAPYVNKLRQYTKL